MSPTLILCLFVTFLLISCNNNPTPTDMPPAPTEATPTKIFYIELIHEGDNPMQQEIIDLFQKQLLQYSYTLKEGAVQKLTTEEKSTTTIIHQFKDIAAYTNEEADAEKIVLSINIEQEAPTMNFHYRSYKKRGHPEWQSVFNPGSFTYPSNQAFEADKAANWLTKYVVLLTFKSNPPIIN